MYWLPHYLWQYFTLFYVLVSTDIYTAMKKSNANAIKHDFRSKNPTTRWNEIIGLK